MSSSVRLRGQEIEDLDEIMHALNEHDRLIAFVRQSNEIENINREPTDAEIKAHEKILARKRLDVPALVQFVRVCQPDAILRATHDIHGVCVGSYVAPPSGPQIVERLKVLLGHAQNNTLQPHEAHCCYEELHPFTDGNGRSGRALWLWHMQNVGQLNAALHLRFLRAFYYQTLAARQA